MRRVVLFSVLAVAVLGLVGSAAGAAGKRFKRSDLPKVVLQTANVPVGYKVYALDTGFQKLADLTDGDTQTWRSNGFQSAYQVFVSAPGERTLKSTAYVFRDSAATAAMIAHFKAMFLKDYAKSSPTSSPLNLGEGGVLLKIKRTLADATDIESWSYWHVGNAVLLSYSCCNAASVGLAAQVAKDMQSQAAALK
jgi:hypothetical protein